MLGGLDRTGDDMPDQSLTDQVAAFAVGRSFGILTTDVDRAARRALLDFIAVAVAGTRHPAWSIAAQTMQDLAVVGPCRLIASALSADPFHAALANGVAAHVLDWDDTLLPARVHLSAALFPPLLAIGEIRNRRLRDILPAFVVGFEIAARLSRALYPSMHQRRWHSTALVAAVGAAIAVGRLLGCNREEIHHGIGIAANSAGGLMSSFGSMSKALNIGRAGALGLQSACLAARGYQSHSDVLGAGDFLEKYEPFPKRELLTEGLGEKWAILENAFKAYPCGFVAHGAIDAVRELRGAAGAAPLRRLAVRVAPEAMQLMGNVDPHTELEAKFSLTYNIALAWVHGNVTPAGFEQQAIWDRQVRAIMKITTIAADAGLTQGEADAEAEFPEGPRTKAGALHARGTNHRQVSDDQLLTKYSEAIVLGGVAHAEGLGETIMRGDDLAAGFLMDKLTRP
jgi:2-methylcitrate dehydratase PrpD